MEDRNLVGFAVEISKEDIQLFTVHQQDKISDEAVLIPLFDKPLHEGQAYYCHVMRGPNGYWLSTYAHLYSKDCVDSKAYK